MNLIKKFNLEKNYYFNVKTQEKNSLEYRSQHVNVPKKLIYRYFGIKKVFDLICGIYPIIFHIHSLVGWWSNLNIITGIHQALDLFLNIQSYKVGVFHLQLFPQVYFYVHHHYYQPLIWVGHSLLNRVRIFYNINRLWAQTRLNVYTWSTSWMSPFSAHRVKIWKDWVTPSFSF